MTEIKKKKENYFFAYHIDRQKNFLEKLLHF